MAASTEGYKIVDVVLPSGTSVYDVMAITGQSPAHFAHDLAYVAVIKVLYVNE